MTKKWTLDDVFVLMERERPPLPARRQSLEAALARLMALKPSGGDEGAIAAADGRAVACRACRYWNACGSQPSRVFREYRSATYEFPVAPTNGPPLRRALCFRC
jgi:hypothetical protein